MATRDIEQKTMRTIMMMMVVSVHWVLTMCHLLTGLITLTPEFVGSGARVEMEVTWLILVHFKIINQDKQLQTMFYFPIWQIFLHKNLKGHESGNYAFSASSKLCVGMWEHRKRPPQFTSFSSHSLCATLQGDIGVYRSTSKSTNRSTPHTLANCPFFRRRDGHTGRVG